MKENWHILGAGAIGCLWACHLSSAGFPVTLILRSSEKLKLFQSQSGIQLSHELYSVRAELATSEESISQLLITTKSPDTQNAFNTIRHRLKPDARIIVLQNGMGTQEWISAQMPAADVVWASTTDGAWLRTPFDLVHAGQGATRMGMQNRVCDWLEPLGSGFLRVEIDDDITLTLWRKLAINCAINPLTAHFQCQNGALVSNPDYLAEMADICHEVETVTAAAGIELFSGPLIEQACNVAELTAQNYSSMMQDVRNGRTTEIDAITGYLCKLADEYGLEVPKNRHYLNKIKVRNSS